MDGKESGAWTGWIVFAGVMLLVIGMFNIFEGFIALFADDRLVLTQENLVIVDTTAWGWTILISGILLIAVAAGLLAAKTWARIAAIVIVCLHAVTQIAWLGAYPVWSLMMVTLDVIVLFALTARWSGVRDRIGALNEEEWVDRDTVGRESAARPSPLV